MAGIVLPAVLLLTLVTTLLGHLVWTVAGLEGAITEARIDRASARADARARLRSIAAVGSQADLPSGLVLDSPGPWLRRYHSQDRSGGHATYVLLRVEPNVEGLLNEMPAGIVSPVLLDVSSRGRIGPSPAGCALAEFASPHPVFGLTLGARRIADWLESPGVSTIGSVTLVPDSISSSGEAADPTWVLSSGPLGLAGSGAVAAIAPEIVVTRGARLRGVLAATGDVTIEDGAEVRGTVLAGGRVRIGGGASLIPDACSRRSALAGSPFLGSRSLGPAGWPLR